MIWLRVLTKLANSYAFRKRHQRATMQLAGTLIRSRFCSFLRGLATVSPTNAGELVRIGKQFDGFQIISIATRPSSVSFTMRSWT